MNKKIAIVFPGQGSQVPGMGKDLLFLPLFRERLEKVADLANLSIEEFFNPKNIKTLAQTEFSQPYIFTISVTLFELLTNKYGLNPIVFGGHSLGEFSALVASGVMSFEDGFKLVQKRGSLMGEACRKDPGGMIAILGADEQGVIEMCNRIIESGGEITIANYNSAKQLVLSGDSQSIEKIKEQIVENLKIRVMSLPVSGAFHSKLMDEANHQFSKYLSAVPLNSPFAPIVMNVTGTLETKKENIYTLLDMQMVSSVLWEKSMDRILSLMPDLILEIGPGRVLSGMFKSTNRNIKVNNIGSKGDWLRFEKEMEENTVVYR